MNNEKQKIIYVSHWRFPSEKTMSPLILRTCQEFARLRATRGQADQGFEVELLIPRRTNFQFRGVDPYEYHGVKKNFSIKRIWCIDLMERVGGDWTFPLLQITFALAVFFKALRKKEAVYYFHDLRDALFVSFLKRTYFLEMHDFYLSSLDFINRQVIRNARGIVSTNKIKMEKLHAAYGFPKERMLHAPNAVDIEMFDPPISKEEARKKLGLPQDKTIILYTGHLFYWKGVDTLLKAAGFFADKRGSSANRNTRINAEEKELLYEDLTYEIRGACFEVWKAVRGAFKEKAVERALYIELEKRGLFVKNQVSIPIRYSGEQVGTYVPDMIVEDKILIELKSKTAISKEDEKQFWLYLKGSEYKLGLLINFGRKLEIKRRVYDSARDQRESAYREARDPRVSAVFYFVGGTDKDIEEFKIKNEKLKNTNVYIVGRRPHSEIPLWQRAADVLVLPNTAKYEESRVETSPVKLFEYMASGTPIVASDIPSIRNIVGEKEVTFFTPDRPRSLAEQITTVLSDLGNASERGIRARELAQAYSWEKRTRSVHAFIKNWI